MRPLQDKCEPTPYEDIEKLFLTDMHRPLHQYFDDFDPEPIGVASLAQVHIARWKDTGEAVAVKLQHPHLQEFAEIDMEMVEVSLGWIHHLFPEFEFTWLGEEMRENLPKEMDFAHEARNAIRTINEFSDIRTSLYIPKIFTADKRVLVMEFIEGGRVDDLKYLADHNIDRNKVALELARIFGQMDPHPGNLLIRPAHILSKSPYNFEIVLLDHGSADRRKYAKLVGNIDDDLVRRATSMIDLTAQTEEEMEAIRNAVVEKEGLLLSVFDVLRRVPRRVLMVLKLNDLTRSLDRALATTHSNLISQMRERGLMSLGLLHDYFQGWWGYQRMYSTLVIAETYMDLQAYLVKTKAWLWGLYAVGGLQGAHRAASGLA
ncbi:ABC1 family-domain-containing protein [Fomitopsis serialis]|uniref:ABC1 family-domain-containing protein n=1 Tax=Fomitopsis serialis TaxID=139415 RepID=UPI002007C48D|nr:ABC1 family-domain-containing protein [Neoantrodia serialis]KAH9935550.1 ABC1 family-domain-containing protein [Neoantrodia serialis]